MGFESCFKGTYVLLRDIRVALRGWDYHNRNNSAARLLQCMCVLVFTYRDEMGIVY